MLRRVFVVVVLLLALPTSTRAQSFFLDRRDPADIRVVTWNIFNDSVFADAGSGNRNAKFNRVAAALDADVWAFQEMYSSSRAEIKSLLDVARPLGNAEGWHVFKSGELAVASKYPIPVAFAGGRSSSALVDLPDAAYPQDLYLINNHYKCCGGFDGERQASSDSNVRGIKDALAPGGAVTLPASTPMIVLGDLNIVDGPQPLDTLLTGNIQNNAAYGPDHPPDWDGTGNTLVQPTHNATGSELYTWRDDASEFAPSRLDYVIYTDSVMTLAHSFVLDSVGMTPDERTIAGLQELDTTINAIFWDHLPVVADFRILPPLVGDANGDRQVDGDDLALWRSRFRFMVPVARTEGDLDNDRDVDGADFLLWQQGLGAGAAMSQAIPEPSILLMILPALFTLMPGSRRLVTRR